MNNKNRYNGFNFLVFESLYMEKPFSYIGKKMLIGDNSYIVLRDKPNVRGRLYGNVVEIVSEPFYEKVDVLGGEREENFVYVRSFDSGLVYRAMFCKDWLISQKYNVTRHDTLKGRIIKINDNSYNKNLATNKWTDLYEKELVIVSEPYFEKVDFSTHIFVNAVSMFDGNIYRVLFNEDALLNKSFVGNIIIINNTNIIL